MKKHNRVPMVLAALMLVATVALAGQAGSGVVNINTADTVQLSLLPRVGPSLAARIVEYRDANGTFKSTEELILVRGIGETTYEQLKAYVTVDGDTTLREPVSVSRADSGS